METYTLSGPRVSLLFFIATLWLLGNRAGAQPGTVDLGFNPLDEGNGTGYGANSRVYAIVAEPNGSYLVGGSLSTYNSEQASYITRVNSQGRKEPGFLANKANHEVRVIAPLPDGKILIGGLFTSYGGVSRNRIARINADGTLDATFNPGTGANGKVQAIAVQSDSMILIGGEFTSINGRAVTYLARLHYDGSLDTTFATPTAANNFIHDIEVQPDQKILIAGEFTNYMASGFNRIARLDTDGIADPGFINSGTGASGIVRRILLRSDGKIVIGGNFHQYNGIARSTLAQLNTDGSLDGSFLPGSGLNNTFYDMAMQPDGKIVAGGQFTTYRGAGAKHLVRINVDGAIDTTFQSANGSDLDIYSVALDTAGNVLIGGDFFIYGGLVRRCFMRVLPTGAADTAFNFQGGANGTILGSARTADNHILIVGDFLAYNNKAKSRVAKIDEHGVLDTTFVSSANNDVHTVAVQHDGKILIGGQFTTAAGVSRGRITRLNADGTSDSLFNPGTGANGTVHAVILQPDGKILVGGSFTTFNGSATKYLARLNADGNLDPTFQPGGGPDNAVQAIAMDQDKILIGGSFLNYNGVSNRRIARLHPDGALDTTFTTGTGFDQDVRVIVRQNEGKLVAGGTFNSFNGVNRQAIVRLNADGSLDNTFSAGITGAVYTIAPLSNGKMVIGGAFYRYTGGNSWVNIARVTTTGAMDPTFVSGSLTATDILTSQILSDDDILVAGSFKSYKGVGRNYIARVNGGNVTPPLTWPQPAPITYGTALSGVQLNASSSVAGTFQYDPPAGTILNAGPDQLLSVVFIPSDPASYDTATTARTITVNKASQTITFDSLGVKALGDSAFALQATASSGLSVSYSSDNHAVATVSGDTVTIAGIGSVTITAMQAGDSNYHAAADVQQVLIVKAAQTITFAPLDPKTYGDAAFPLEASASSGLPMSFTSSNEDVAVVYGDTVTIVGAGETTITASQPGDDSYFEATPVARTLTVTKATQTITFDPITQRTYHSPAFVVDATTSSGLPVTYTSSDTLVAEIDGSTVTIKGTGETTITASQAGDANHLPASADRVLVVSKSGQSISFESLPTPVTFGSGKLPIEAMATSSLPVSIACSNTSVAIIEGDSIRIVGAGSATITASQEGDDHYFAATPVEQTLVVDKAAQSITFEPLPEKTFGDSPFQLSASATSGMSVVFTSNNPEVAVIDGTSVTIVGAGSAFITAQQSGDGNYMAATEISRELVVNKNTQVITFDPLEARAVNSDPFTIEATTTSGLAITFTSSNQAVATVEGNTVTLMGAGTTIITASQAGDQNHLAAEDVTRTLEVTKASQLITFDDIPDKVFGATPFELSASTTSGLEISFSSSNTSVATVNGKMVTIVGAGVTTITASQPGNGVYTASETSQELLVTKASQIITFDAIPAKNVGDRHFQSLQTPPPHWP
ncbi:MAG TPA: delta-60 repeat domain-containing protein [Chryseosolibacter sp.]|nr:delta-60 repeat domain-containing protein [Chryseosolibacter sp.]